MATFQTVLLLVGVSRDVIKRLSGEVETQLELRLVYDVQIMAFWRSSEKLFLALHPDVAKSDKTKRLPNYVVCGGGHCTTVGSCSFS